MSPCPLQKPHSELSLTNPTGHSLRVHISGIELLALAAVVTDPHHNCPEKTEGLPQLSLAYSGKRRPCLPLVLRFPGPFAACSCAWLLKRTDCEENKQHCYKDVLIGSAPASPIKGLVASFSVAQGPSNYSRQCGKEPDISIPRKHEDSKGRSHLGSQKSSLW